MAVEGVVRTRSVPGLSAGSLEPARLNKRGEIVAMPWHVQLALEGKVFIANRGTATTPVSFAKTAYDEDQPQLTVIVGSASTVIIPLFLEVVLEDSAGTDNELIWSYTSNDIGNGTSTAVTPVNANPALKSAGSAVTARRDYTANATAATNLTEFARYTYAFADATTDPAKRFALNYMDSQMPALVGPATLQLHVAAATTAPSGFATAIWAEFAASDLYE